MLSKKNKTLHRFKVGDYAMVLCTKPERFLADPTKPANEVEVVKVTPLTVVVQALNATDDGRNYRPCFVYKRKGNCWIEDKKDHFYLVPA